MLYLLHFFYFWTNLGPIQVELMVKHIIRPQWCKSRILEDLTDIVILGPVVTLRLDFIRMVTEDISLWCSNQTSCQAKPSKPAIKIIKCDTDADKHPN